MTELTPKQESFCQKYIETGNASEAYRLSYDAENMKPETVWVKACELLKNGKVAARVEQLQAHHLRRHNVTVDTITAELEELKSLATLDKQYSPAITAVMGKAKIHGLLIDKAEITGKDGGPIVTKEQRDAAVAAALGADA